MKRNTLFLILLGFVGLTIISSCGNDDDNYTVCQICDEYEGLINGSAQIGGASEVFNNSPLSISISHPSQYEIDNYETIYQFGLTQFGATFLNIDGDLTGNVLTYNNEVWNFEGYSIIINGSCTFSEDFSQINGTFTFSGAGSGTITYFGNN